MSAPSINFTDPEVSRAEKVKAVEDSPDLIMDLIYSYQIASLEEVKKVLFDISISPLVSNTDRYTVLELLYEQHREEVEPYLASFVPDVPVMELRVLEWLFSLQEDGEEKYEPRLYKYLHNTALSDMVRFNAVFGFRAKYPIHTLRGVKYLLTQPISSRCTILAAQYVLQHDYEENEELVQRVFAIAQNTTEEYNTRADAADVVHHYGTSEIQAQALKLLRELGGSQGNLYKDKQNVHSVDVSEGLELIERLEPSLSFEEIARNLSQNDRDISLTLGRIAVDSAQYGNKTSQNKFTSVQILERLWTYIQNSGLRETLLQRLHEEMRDMAETCSSGHALRLLNVLSGFGADVKISFEDQIKSNFEGRLMKRLREEKESEEILDQITDRGPLFMSFFLRHKAEIERELLAEFVPDHLDEDTFYEYLKKAFGNYEGSVAQAKLQFTIATRK